ncbi:MAG: sulfatase-like hydrolase/transferase [Lentimonas sp.]
MLFIYTDQHHAEFLGCAGAEPLLRTPNIDSLAQDGVRFTNHYCPSPVCGPSRSATLSGRYPPDTGRTRNDNPLPNNTTLFTDHLSAAGYYNGLVGKLHLAPNHHPFGFDWKQLMDAHYGCYNESESVNNDYFDYLRTTPAFIDNPDSVEPIASASERTLGDDLSSKEFWLGHEWVEDKHTHASWSANQAIRFFDEAPDDAPFFLNLSFFGPHHPYTTAAPWTEMYDPEDVTLPKTIGQKHDTPAFMEHSGKKYKSFENWSELTWRQYRAQYCGQISQIDHHLGRVFDELKKRDQWDNTLVVFTSDHGDSMGEWMMIGKSHMLEGASKVPMILKTPGKNPQAGTTVENITNGIDLYGTFLAAGGITKESAQQPSSRNLLPLVNGSSSDWNDETFSIIGRERNECLTMLRTKRWKLVHRSTPDSRMLFELYDMQADPEETNDLYPESKDKLETKALQAKLINWLDEQWA